MGRVAEEDRFRDPLVRVSWFADEFRGSTSLLERLPAWLKSAKNRDEVLRVARRLRATTT